MAKGLPVCPREGNEGSMVVKGGFYGRGSLRRQQYKCSPLDGSKPHRFAPVLPRVGAVAHDCGECEVHLPKGHGRQGPRTSDFDARTIAAALVAVGGGRSYLRSAADARVRLPRNRKNRAAAAQLVSDWVEVYTPVLWEALRPVEWPDVIVCDSSDPVGPAQALFESPFYKSMNNALRAGGRVCHSLCVCV